MFIDSAEALAHATNKSLKLGLTPRPWNQFAPAETFWWLSPSTDWPAYRYGKLAFSLARDTPRKDLLGRNDALLEVDKIFAGFNVEKGYGEVAKFVNPALKHKPLQIIDPQWLWFEIISEDGSLRFARTLTAASTNSKLFAYVVAGYAHDRESTGPAKHDAVMFECKGSDLKALLHNGFPIDALRSCAASRNFPELASYLRQVDDYHWVDLYVGTHLSKGDVDLANLHRTVLSCFDAWLR